jgi:dihydrodipicolinate synthase/N-acetylneuraminate lyase
MTDINQPAAVEQPTAEEIARHYSAALDSVNLINSTKPENTTDEEWEDTIKRNVDHLKIMVAKDFMQDQDLAPLEEAIEANE